MSVSSVTLLMFFPPAPTKKISDQRDLPRATQPIDDPRYLASEGTVIILNVFGVKAQLF